MNLDSEFPGSSPFPSGLYCSSKKKESVGSRSRAGTFNTSSPPSTIPERIHRLLLDTPSSSLGCPSSSGTFYLVKSELAGSSTFSLAFSRKPFTNWQPQGMRRRELLKREIQSSSRSQSYSSSPSCLEAPVPARPSSHSWDLVSCPPGSTGPSEPW